MATNSLRLAATVLLGTSLALWLGCGRDAAVEIRKDRNGDEHLRINDERIRHDLHQAGQELSKDAQNLGQAVKREARDVDHRIGSAARETLADTALTARVKARLIAAPDLDGIRIHVSSRDGEVTLDGTVASAEYRADAEKIARRTEGVREVIDRLQVGATG